MYSGILNLIIQNKPNKFHRLRRLRLLELGLVQTRNTAFKISCKIKILICINIRTNYSWRQWAVGILLLVIASSARAQTHVNLKFGNLTTSEGLSNNSIRCILQDSQGFMWFGTLNGLNRYDGYTFEVFRPQWRNDYSISDHQINFLYEDSQKELWVATNGGISKYDRKYNRFISYKTVNGNISNAIWEDKENNLWVSSYNRIYKLDKKSNQFVPFPKFTDALITSAITLPDHTFLIGTHNVGLIHLDVQSGKIKQYLNNPDNENSLCHNEITALKLEENQKVWISTRNGLDVFTVERSTFTHVGKGNGPQKSLLNQSVRCSVHFKGDEVWIGTQSGISILNKKSNQFTHQIPNNYNARSLSDMSIWPISEDQQGRMWIGTYSGGINVIDPLVEQFTKESPVLEEYDINSILEDSKNRLWIGTEKGIVLNDHDQSYLFSHNPNDLKSIPSNTILNLFEDKNNNLWIATWNGGLSRFDEQSKTFINFEVNTQNPDKLASKNVYSIAQSSLTDQLLIASFDGFHILTSKENQDFINYKHNPNDKKSLSANFCRVVHEDSKGNIWIGTDRGFNHFEIRSKKFTRFLHNESDTTSISNNFINCVFEDSKQRLWVGTANGLNMMTPDNHFKVHLNTDDAYNYIQSILEDENGNIWLSTISGGISKYNPSKQTFENYNDFNSSFTNDFRSNSAHKAKDGKLYFGGGKGLYGFYPNRVNKNKHLPTILFTDLKVLNQSVKIGDFDSLLTQHISSTKEIILNHTLSAFSIEFIALSLTQSKKNLYAYKLDGFNKDWVYAGKKREANYTNLDAGTYIFRVKASNNDGVWNEEGASITIIMLDAWWETWWFKTSMLLLVFIGGFYLYKLRIKAIKNQKLEKDVAERTLEINQNREELKNQKEKLELLSENLAKVNESKDRLFAMLAHELKSPIKSLSGLMDLISKKYISPQVLQMYTNKLKVDVKQLYFTLNNLLFWAKGQMQGLVSHQQSISLYAVVESNFNLAHEIGFAKRIELINLVHQNVTLWADADHIDIVLRNLLNNAIKFTQPDGIIRVAANLKGKFCEISIQDNGVGIATENLSKIFNTYYDFTTRGTDGEKGTGLGLSICQELIEMNGGEIWVESELGIGTTFYFTLKLQN